jgi:hypothetical protein
MKNQKEDVLKKLEANVEQYVEEYKGYHIISRKCCVSMSNDKCECISPFDDQNPSKIDMAKYVEWCKLHKNANNEDCSDRLYFDKQYFAFVKKPRQRIWRRLDGFDFVSISAVKERIDKIESGTISLMDML